MKITNLLLQLILHKLLILPKIYDEMTYNFTAEIIHDNEIHQYIGIVPGLPGAHSQAPTLDELYINLQEVIQMCLEEMTEEEKLELPHFIGTQNISVAV